MSPVTSKVNADVKNFRGELTKKRISLTHVKISELHQGGLFSRDRWDITGIEKLLLLIQRKHDNKVDFNLDDDDIKKLKEHLAYRWKKLVTQCGEQVAAKRYFFPIDRKDKVYIAVAELLVRNQSSKESTVYTYELLMPGYSLFFPSQQLEAQQLPDDYARQITSADTTEISIEDIPLSDLAFISSDPSDERCSNLKYALSIGWIINQYDIEYNSDQGKKVDPLWHPYLNRELSDNELKELASYTRAEELKNKLINKSGITADMIAMLEDFLNNAIFDTGFSGNYFKSQNEAAQRATIALLEKIEKLNSTEKKIFYSEKIPNSNSTLGKILANIIKGDDRQICITTSGVEIGKLIAVYKGAKGVDGLKCRRLIHWIHASNVSYDSRSFSSKIQPKESFFIDAVNIIQKASSDLRKNRR